jgi:hypothetical protein
MSRPVVRCVAFAALLLLLTACLPATPPPATASPATLETTGTAPSPTHPASASATASPEPLPSLPSLTPSPLPPDFWQSLPVIPSEISPRVREVYRLGQELGNQAHIFTRIGDCASATPAFLVGFDRNYNLGEYTSLQPAVDYFQGSFERPSLAAKAGLNTAGVLSSLWTGEQCRSGETLLDCQYRLDQPAFAFISLGTNEAYYVHRDPASFERNLRQIIDATLAQGIIPILVTKADNVEGDHSINATIARLALEYELPLWNFWLAVQPLPDQGMIEPEHLSSVSYVNFTDFTIPHSLEYGMQMRNLTALQMLYFLWEQLVQPPSPTP